MCASELLAVRAFKAASLKCAQQEDLKIPPSFNTSSIADLILMFENVMKATTMHAATSSKVIRARCADDVGTVMHFGLANHKPTGN